MSVDYHRHCQATVLAATGTAQGNGATWGTLYNLNTPNIGEDWKSSFLVNKDITDDLAQIILLIDKHIGKLSQGKNYKEGDLISITNETVSVRNGIDMEYEGPVGIETAFGGRRLVECNISVENIDDDGEVIAYLVVGNRRLPIKANIQQIEPTPPQPSSERYVITEDRYYDIVLSGGENDGEPLDYTDELRYMVTENEHEYDIGVSGYGDSVSLNYNED